MIGSDEAMAVVATAAAVLVWPRRGRPIPEAAGSSSGSPRSARPTSSRARRRLVEHLASRPDASPLGRRVVLVAVGLGAVGLWTLRWSEPLRSAMGVALPVLGVVAVVVLGRLEPVTVRRRRVRLVLDLPQALDLLAAGLAAGRPLRSATEAVAEVLDGPLAADLAEVVAAVRLGRAEDEAWRELRGHPVLGPVAIDLARSAASGTRLVELLGVHARVARRLRQAELEAMARAVGVRCVVPLMVCFLPAFLLIGVVPIIGSVLSAALR
ncbi:MAG: type II secretion system F family protein [Propionibacteriaceae bacterium]